MRNCPALVFWAAIHLVAMGQANAQAHPDRMSLATPSAAERTHPGSLPVACSPPKRAPAPPKAPPKATPPAAPSAGSVIQVCAPVFSMEKSTRANQAPEAPLAPPQETQTPQAPKAPASAASAPVAPSPPVESVDSFKFKIKDLLEAEMKSSSRWLVGSLLVIFVVFSVLIVLATKAVAKRPKGPWVVAFVGIILAGALAFFMIQRITKNPVESATIEKLYELTPSTTALPDAFDPKVWAMAEQIQRQLAAMQADVREQHRSLTLQLEALSNRSAPVYADATSLWSASGCILVAGLLLVLGAGASLIALGKVPLFAQAPLAGKRQAAQPTAKPEETASQTLPLNAIYRLEDLLSQLRMSSDKTYRLLESDKAPALADPGAFLLALNNVRRQMEGGLGIDRALAGETPVPDASYRFRTETKFFTFYDLNTALDTLDEALSSRYALQLDEWRPQVLMALAKARRALITVCEPVDENSEPKPP